MLLIKKALENSITNKILKIKTKFKPMKKQSNISNPEILKKIWESKQQPEQIRGNFNVKLYLKILKIKLNECK